MISPEVLRRFPHFAGIEDECLGEVARLSEEFVFKAGRRALQGERRVYRHGAHL